ncbi:carboxymuconolactone decarboxylase family protein [Fimbriiglobus ruber]|nr:carboxymuconolactone decarboxylase family protein [Fimbriiglobus ruber]
MAKLPKPPDTFVEFTRQFPQIAEAWRLVQDAGQVGPFDEKTQRLVKLAVAIGTMREGSVHSAVRKAVAFGVTKEEIDQTLALAAGTLGFPASVAAFSWVRDELAKGAETP